MALRRHEVFHVAQAQTALCAFVLTIVKVVQMS